MHPIRFLLLACGLCSTVACHRSDAAGSDPAAAQAGAGGAPAPAKAADATMQRAIDRVYPALVQVRVLVLSEQEGRERKGEGAGSGVIISPTGLVVTNYHVAGNTADIRCVLSDREEVAATLVGADPLTDIAVLQLDLSGRRDRAPLVVAAFGSSAHAKVGDHVFAMGCPGAISQSVTSGIISNVGMTLPRWLRAQMEVQGENVGSTVKWIGHDAIIYFGNSGGPLVDEDGAIIGINELSYGSMGGAIPADLVKAVCDQLIAKGRVERTWTGAFFQPLLTAEVRKGNDRGVLVSGVLEGAPADGRLVAGDVVLAVNHHDVQVRYDDELPTFQNFLWTQPPGQPLLFAVRRGGMDLSVSVAPVARDEARAKSRESTPWGMTLRRVSVSEAKSLHRADTAGILVGSVRRGGPVDSATPSLRQDDVITEIDGKPVATVEEFTASTAAVTKDASGPTPVTVRFERDGEQLMTVVEIGRSVAADPSVNARHGWLSVATQVLSPKLAKALGLKGRKGVRVTQVLPGGVAEKAGFQVGDIITKVDDQLVEAATPQDAQLFEALVRAYKPDAVVAFTVYRSGTPQTITVQLSPAPEQDSEMRAYEDAVLEFKVRDIAYADRIKNRWSPDQGGAVVVEAEPGGWAAVGGLENDDLILSVDGVAVASTAGLTALLQPIEKRKATHLTLFVRRGVTTTFVEVQPAWPSPPQQPHSKE